MSQEAYVVIGYRVVRIRVRGEDEAHRRRRIGRESSTTEDGPAQIAKRAETANKSAPLETCLRLRIITLSEMARRIVSRHWLQ